MITLAREWHSMHCGFNRRLTSEEDFHLHDESTKKVHMMQQFTILSTIGAAMVELPYKEGRIVMQAAPSPAARQPYPESLLPEAGSPGWRRS
jgi:hypothetical protein